MRRMHGLPKGLMIEKPMECLLKLLTSDVTGVDLAGGLVELRALPLDLEEAVDVMRLAAVQALRRAHCRLLRSLRYCWRLGTYT
jgi:hypothetical protein